MPVVFETVTRRPVSSRATRGPLPSRAHRGPVSSGAHRGPVRRGARRALTLTVLTAVTLPLFSAAALADGGRIGTKYNPDPLSPLDTWLIYGGTIVGGFLLAIVLTALSGRKSTERYRPGQPWDHDAVQLGGDAGDRAAGDLAGTETSKEPAGTATPASGGASGQW
jgi:hypothetical protein